MGRKEERVGRRQHIEHIGSMADSGGLSTWLMDCMSGEGCVRMCAM